MFKYSTLLLAFMLISQVATPTAWATCADVTVVFARGTAEAEPIGSIIGPPFKAALQSALGTKSLNFIGVTYAADIASFEVGGDPAGSKTLAADVTAQVSACPNTKIVISGYSQGAQLVHKGSVLLSTSVQSRVNAVVMFGDPDNGQALPGVLNSRGITFCATGDIICLGGQIITVFHMGYGANATAAASFVVSEI
ncbi:carbohydrate esterase family 5 protein [Sphaerobolus stellatus SS14]|uniref:Cutinase n=1 Tax=Sphaerobolus stellatus (strain SS14) TaxID=990650 RepID=A0A0C9T1M8_SPHS4|nr:carbohydrate esterase family 5 protein [Sphaerobolus stellatus SS14]KIJ22698.1 carbohydrate esterase family 5 protein [Sphaerobolus stellatus SS14]